MRFLGHLDHPIDGERVGSSCVVRGWALGPAGPARRVDVLVDGSPVATLGILRQRPDVVDVHGDRAALAGFEGWVELGAAASSAPVAVTAVATFAGGIRLELQPASVHRSAAARTATRQPGARAGARPDGRAGAVAASPAEPLRLLCSARSLDRGGSQLRLAELVGALHEQGVARATVTSPHDGPLRASLEAAGAAVVVEAGPSLADPAGYADAVATAAAAAAGRFDVLYAPTLTSFPAVAVAHRAGIPSVWRVGECEPLPVVASWLGVDLDPGLEAEAVAALEVADAVIGNSEAVVARLRALAPSARLHVISTGVDLDALAPPTSAQRQAARAALGYGAGERILLCTGTMWPVKAQAMAIAALAEVAPGAAALHLALVGQQDGSYVGAVRSQAAEAGLADRVRIEGFVDDLADWYHAADAFVLPSESESLSASLLEAMAAGLPVVASAVGGTPEVVVPGVTGWLCHPGDLDALVAALADLAGRTTDELEAMGRRGRAAVAEAHDRRAVLDRTAALLRGAAGSP